MPGASRCSNAATRRLQALQELDLDHQAGKLTDEDAERERRTLRDEAVATLAELESLEASPDASTRPA